MKIAQAIPLSNSSFLFAISPFNLFTGLVETKSRVLSVVSDGPGCVLDIDATGLFENDAASGRPHSGTAIGDSISINGCCLTVVEADVDNPAKRLAFQAGSETLSRTNLGRLVDGDWVNLERALAVGDRLGGHYVSGHIDAVGELLEKRDEGPWSFLKFSIPERYGRQVAGKGSIAIDGISLTVVDAAKDWFTVALIPHTLAVTTLGDRAIADIVNLETDVLAKYVEKWLAKDTPAPSESAASVPPVTERS